MQTQTEARPMLAYHGDPAIKRKYLARVRAHAKADELIKGQYWQDGKGCAVGCTIHGSNHAAYETELGIPASIAHLEDTLFERLDNGTAQAWPARFLKAIKPGADLSLVTARFMHWLLVDPTDGVIRFAGDCADVKAAIEQVAGLHARLIAGGSVTDSEWNAAAGAAWAAAEAGWTAAAAAESYERMADKLIELLEEAQIYVPVA